MPKASHEHHQPHNLNPQFAPNSISVGGIRGFLNRFRRPLQQPEYSGVEQAEFTELEVPPAPEADNYSLLKSFVSGEALDAVIFDAKKVLDAPDMQEIAELVAKKEAYNDDAREADMKFGYAAAKPLYDQADIVSDYLQSPSVGPVFLKYAMAVDTKEFAERGRRRVAGDSPEAEELVGLLKQVPQMIPDKNAPFAEYKNNNETAWQYVEDASVRKYLASRQFIDTSIFGYGNGSVTLDKVEGKPYEVPLSAVVSAAGFDSWEGRNPRQYKSWNSKYGGGDMKSLAVIKHYAGLETELPPVGKMNVYVQPDGQVFCDNNSGDSHRIAAAILRGQDTIKADELEFILLEKNLVEGPK